MSKPLPFRIEHACKVNEPVPLFGAFAWECPQCHHRNYVDPVDLKMSPEEYREACIVLEIIEPWQETPEEGSVTAAPDFVTCSKCKEQYPAFDGDEGDDDDRDGNVPLEIG